MTAATASTTAEPPPLLSLEDLTVQVPGTARPLLDSITLTVAEGEVVGLVGESGSGKSTTAKAALGLLPTGATSEGSVHVDGRDVLRLRGEALRTHRANTVAMIHQDPRATLNPVRRIGDFLVERGATRERAVELLAAVGLSALEHRVRQRPHELSGGMLQRVVIAGALAARPPLLLADEATSALDVTTQAEILQLLDDIRQDTGVALVFVSHDLAVVQHVTDEVLVMRRGRTVEQGPTRRVLTEPSDPYTRLLLASVPGEGWDPADAVAARASLSA